MGKRSQKRPLRFEKNQVGCMSGLVSIFDFRHGRFTQKLLSDRKHGSRQIVGSENSRTNLQLLTSSGEKPQELNVGEESKTIDKASVKNLIQEAIHSGVDKKQSDLKQGDQKRKTRKGTNKKICENHENSSRQSSTSLDLDDIMEALCGQIHQKTNGCIKHDPSSENVSVSEEMLSEATKVFINKSFIINGKHFDEDGKVYQAKELSEALETLKTNKELFLKLLQDPNSLLVKHIQNWQHEQMKNEEKSKAVVKELVSNKNRNIFGRKVKHEEVIENPQTPDRIVVLKPGPTHSMNDETIHSHFSLTEIKRKLKYAMGKERNSNSRETSSQSVRHISLETMGKTSFGELKESEITIESETNTSVPDIYIEAKRHLSEMLRHGDEDNVPSKRVPKTLGRILSLPQYNFSPPSSPGRDGELGFVTAKMRFSNYNNIWKFNENTWRTKRENVSHLSPLRQTFDSPSPVSDHRFDDRFPVSKPISKNSEKFVLDNNTEEMTCATTEQVSFEGNVEIEKSTYTKSHDESHNLNISSEPSTSLITENHNSGDTTETIVEGSSECLKQDVYEENQTPPSPSESPSSSLMIAKRVDDVEGDVDRTQRPSPVSVLEALFTEDEVSPASTRCLSEPRIQPLRIPFEEVVSSSVDQGICITCMEDKKLAFEYVKTVIQASGLSWDDLLTKSLSSNPFLETSLFHEVELFSTQFFYDRKLLFDCINEVLLEVIATRISFVKSQKRRPPHKTKDIINEVWGRIDWHIVPFLSPRTLDQIVGKDILKPGSWMDLGFDIQSVGTDVEEVIFTELIEETLFLCVNDDFEDGFSLFSSELKENERINDS